MNRLIPLALLLAPILPPTGTAETYHATAPSSITVESGPDGLTVRQRAVRHEVYGATPLTIRVGQPIQLRLATITTLSETRRDDQTSRIDVTVDALADGAARRIASFSDPGSESAVSAPFFVTTQRGCCSPLTRYHVRDIETGTRLFTATGPGLSGLVALMRTTTQQPAIKRWAAFEGLPEAAPDDRSLLGYVRYGDRTGPLDTLAVHMQPADQPDELPLALPTCGALLWRDTGRPPMAGQPHRAAAGTCFKPPGLSYETPLFALGTGPQSTQGIELELSLDGTVYATLPIAADRFDIPRATLAHGVRLVRAPPR